MSEMNDTQPSLIPPGKVVKKSPFWITLLVFVLLIVFGILGGYGSGLAQRRSAEATDVSQKLGEQFQLGLDAMDAGQYSVARDHFEYVIQHDSNFPGVQDAYVELLRRINVSPTPTVTQTPTITPTPDLRSAEEIYNSARQLLAAEDWDGTIKTLDSLRKVAPLFHAAEVDGMYYIALRNRGIGKIFAQNCEDINLEGGVYDMSLAENFGPLDGYADGLRTAARLYITAASFWELDMGQASNYFGQVMLTMPNMMDASCKSATERWHFATIEYADLEAAAGNFCHAQQLFEAAFEVPSDQDAESFDNATDVYKACNPGAVSPPGETPTPAAGP